MIAALFPSIWNDYICLRLQEVRGSNMGILKRMWKAFRKFWHSGEAMSHGIDCHKWESKVEMFRNFSSRGD